MKEFKPFDKVLVRNSFGSWYPDLYSHYNGSSHKTITDHYCNDKDILPYEGNEHLLGTNEEPEEEITLKKGERIVVSDNIYALLNGLGVVEIFDKIKCKSIYDSQLRLWSYCIPYSQFKEKNTKHDILCIRHGKLVRYY